MTEINQKEYLKKYLGIGKDDGKKKKRKKKSKNIIGPGLKIVDDDLDISEANTVEEAVSLLATNEDAPQVVGVIDERPLALRIDDYRKSDRWKVIGEDNDNLVGTQNLDKDNSPPRKKIENVTTRKRSNHSDSDSSPPRKNRSVSPVDIRKHHGSDTGSTKRKLHRNSHSPKRPSLYNSDSSPPRKRRFTKSPDRRKIHHSSPRRENRSPVNKKQYDSDNSPQRNRNISRSPEYIKKRRDSDNSPPRKRNRSSENTQRKHYDSDNSPPRKFKSNSPKTRYDSDNSPPRRNVRKSPENTKSRDRYEKQNKVYSRRKSPERERSWGHKDALKKDNRGFENKTAKESKSYKRDKESESPKRKQYNSDSSPQRKNSKNRTLNEDKTSKKMTKTLDGKTAGLQNAKDLDAETVLLKIREDEQFKNLSAEVSGVNAATIIRDRKTGKIRDLKKEAEEKKEKEKRETAHKEKYTRWGKGLKQVEDREEKLAQDAYEMTKPLARYVDDVDLEQHLKEQEREGDPMLAYMRSKKKKEVVATGKPSKPQYDGEFMPNRYGIPPGHRWDGVDRSSGYEKRWFETQNAKKAQEEDTYKWSTEDM